MDLMYIENKARQHHSSDATGHDFSHIERVKNNAIKIASHYIDADINIICCAALLHDVADHKLIDAKDHDVVIDMMRGWIKEAGGSDTTANDILHICQNISFSTRDKNDSLSLEGQIVQDADRLDAIGAIGIARTFAYGGAKGRKMYGEDGSNDTLSHFYEKLLMIKDLMNTHIGHQMAEERHHFMKEFLSHFYDECSLK
jgi:uncharacterized protein